MEIVNMFNKVLGWVIENKIEIFGVLTLLAYLYFSIKQNSLLWFFGLIGSLLYVYIYHSVKLYADMGLQVYYVIISIYGWIYWKVGKQQNDKPIEIKFTNKALAIQLIWITTVLFFAISYILNTFTDASLPYWDALTTAGGITATWMLARKYIEHWLIWVIVDLISLVMYIYKGLYITSVLFVIYTAMAIVGYIEWKKSMLIAVQK